MDFRIGGEFEISYQMLAKPMVNSYDFSYSKKNNLLVNTGRGALYLALQKAKEFFGFSKAWVPAYCCSSVLLPFRQLGFEISYYSLGNELRQESYLPKDLGNSIFLFIHYFGKKNQVVVDYLTNQSKDSIIFEDCVQASLSNNVGQTGHFVFNSYRKFFPQPDGAVIASNYDLSYNLLPADEQFVMQKLLGKIIRHQSQDEKLFLPFF